MIYMSKIPPSELLAKVPDFSNWAEAKQWIENGINIIQQVSPKSISELEFTSLEWSDNKVTKEHPFGLYTSLIWRKLVLATFLADLISYPQLADQVSFERLLFVMHTYPQAFRVWWIKLPTNQWWPVGYSAVYPMYETTFEQFEKHSENLKDRLVAPNIYLNGQKPFLYLFNYSVAPLFKKSDISKELMKKLASDVHSYDTAGIACITVSDEGVRIAQRFGMELSGYLTFEGSKEGVYTKRMKAEG